MCCPFFEPVVTNRYNLYKLLLTKRRLIRSKVSEPNGTSFILKEMIPAYRAASQERGESVDTILSFPRLTR